MNKNIGSKSSLAIALSRLDGFFEPKVCQEQYITDSEIAASILWNAYYLKDIEDKIVADLGCGTGVLGFGALLLGARQVFFIDSDESALEKAKINFSKLKSEGYILGKADFMLMDIEDFDGRQAEVIIQNPPFGTKSKGADVKFLEKAFKIAPIVYSLHKSETLAYLEKFATKKSFKITHKWHFVFPMKATYLFHRRQIHRIKVSCIRFEK